MTYKPKIYDSNDENLQTVTSNAIQCKVRNIAIAQGANKNTTTNRDLNEEENRVLMNICEEYSDVFHLEGDQLTYTEITR